ncbi:hypothetical protein [Streptomyces sp. NPDC097619]|uniref:hypothetical protein n=1 Tax=Streptomyces sp. NPDC097619 TaxID=3157228 RepID=UPI0033198FFE
MAEEKAEAKKDEPADANENVEEDRGEQGGPEQAPSPRALLADEGAMVDEHGRPPGVASRTGTGAGPAADPARVARARAEADGTER